MEWLRNNFGRRPVDIAFRELRKAERQLLDVEFDLEMHLAAREYLQRRIDRLTMFVKTDGLDRTNFTGTLQSMANRRLTRTNADFQTPYRDPLSIAAQGVVNIFNRYKKRSIGN